MTEERRLIDYVRGLDRLIWDRYPHAAQKFQHIKKPLVTLAAVEQVHRLKKRSISPKFSFGNGFLQGIILDWAQRQENDAIRKADPLATPDTNY